MNDWQLFARSCWECDAIQTELPEHWMCSKCRAALEIEVPAETGQSTVVRPGPEAAPESGEPGVRMEPQLKRR